MIMSQYSNNRPSCYHKRSISCNRAALFVQLHIWNQGNGVNRKIRKISNPSVSIALLAWAWTPETKRGCCPQWRTLSHYVIIFGREEQGISCFDLLTIGNMHQLSGDTYSLHLQGTINFVAEFCAVLGIRCCIISPKDSGSILYFKLSPCSECCTLSSG